MHSSRMCTARTLQYGGVSLTETPLERDPPCEHHRQVPCRNFVAGGNQNDIGNENDHNVIAIKHTLLAMQSGHGMR